MKHILLMLFVLSPGVTPCAAQAQDSLVLASLSAGWAHVCGVTKEGGAYCWGWNPGGALGSGDTVNSTTPVAVNGGLAFTTLAAGLIHTCALALNGAAYCWGENDEGQLGAATSERCTRLDNHPCSSKALRVSGGLAFTAISAGLQHTCALTQTGEAYCWGRNALGQHGDGDTLNRGTMPTAVAGGVSFVALSVGGFHTCGLTAAGEAYCWGGNSLGQLGRDHDTTRGVSPAPVSGDHRFRTLAAGRAHTCGVTEAQAVLCWGFNADGQLGSETAERCAEQRAMRPCSTKPVPISGDFTASAVSAGAFHTCALTAAGEAYCWGGNDNGQLGDGTATSGPAARRVATALRFVALAAGARFTCGLTATGAAYCWGANQNGQLGAATGTDSGLPARVVAATAMPTPVPRLTIPGATLADEALQRDTREYLLTIGAALAGMSCPHARITNTEVTQPARRVKVRDGRMVRGEWVERWTVNYCGTRVAFRIAYSADGRGGVTFAAQKE